jgi:hypothetical protein
VVVAHSRGGGGGNGSCGTPRISPNHHVLSEHTIVFHPSPNHQCSIRAFTSPPIYTKILIVFYLEIQFVKQILFFVF